jgi:hypothetical protein
VATAPAPERRPFFWPIRSIFLEGTTLEGTDIMNALTLYILLDVSDIEQFVTLRAWHAAMLAWTRSEQGGARGRYTP